MLTKIEKRFRSGGIDAADCAVLKRIILSESDESALESAIQMYGRSCAFDGEVLEMCKKYFLQQPVPGLTAVCMRTALEYWGLWKQYPEALSAYLDFDLYDEWYDEVIFACSFCSKVNAEGATKTFSSQLATLLEAAKLEGRTELLELASRRGQSG